MSWLFLYMNTQKLIEQLWTQVLSQRVYAGRQITFHYHYQGDKKEIKIHVYFYV